MANIIDVINRIGKEVRGTIETKRTDLYFQETSLLYSLAENLLKYLVATKNCWDENCKLVDENEAREAKGETVTDDDYDFNGEKIRKKAKKMRFVDAIDTAFDLRLISKNLKDRFHTFRQERNDLIHELYLFEKRDDTAFMKKRLEDAEAIVSELVPVFEHLIFEEIGVDIDEALETL